MPSQWYPISPTLTDTGAFAALAGLENGASLRPVPRQTHRLALAELDEQTRELSLMGRLGLAGVGQASTSHHQHMLVRDLFAWEECIRPAEDDGLIRGTRWGVGFRLKVTWTGSDAALGTSGAGIAALVELSVVNASFELETVGIVAPDVLRSVPIPGRFDQDAYAAIQGAEQRLRTHMADHLTDLPAQPVQILLHQPLVPNRLPQARARLFAVQHLYRRWSLPRTLRRAQRHQLSLAPIRETYRDFGVVDTNRPSRAVRQDAAEWLDDAFGDAR